MNSHAYAALRPARALLARIPLGLRPSLHRLRGSWLRRGLLRSGSLHLVRRLHSYYGGVRLLVPVRHRLRLISDMYARAREERADRLFEELFEIADKPCKDAVEVAHARNRLDTRKWLASKLAPRKYGDRVEHDHKGGLNFQPAVLVQIGRVEQPTRTISGDPHSPLPNEE